MIMSRGITALGLMLTAMSLLLTMTALWWHHDRVRELFNSRARCYLDTIPVVKVPKPQNAQDKADEQAAQELLMKHYQLPCTSDSVVFYGRMERAGFGNILTYQLIGLHHALHYSTPYIWADVMDHHGPQWPGVEPAHFMRPRSACAKFYDRNRNTFHHVVPINMDSAPPTMSAKLPQFQHRPLLWWYRQMLDFYFRPDAVLDWLARSPHPRSLSLVETGTPCSYLFPMKTEPADIAYNASALDKSLFAIAAGVLPFRATFSGFLRVGLHIRRGDSCQAYNRCRPPCENATVYANAIRRLRRETETPLLVYISTDDPDAAEAVKSELSGESHLILVSLVMD